MPTYNYKSREIIAKIVYYGPGRCGKTTNLQQIHARMRPETRSELLSVATETDRTIYFDLLPLNLGTISGMKFMVRLFTVPGQVYYSETRKLVLRGADGIVFCADSQDHMMDENRESLRDLKTNLAANGIDYSTIPLSLQYNKRDLPRLIPEAELDATLNDRGVKAISAIASRGEGVLETLRYITVSVFNSIKSTTGAQQGQQPKQPSAPQGVAPVAPAISSRPQSAPEMRGPPSSPMISPPGLGGLSPPPAAEASPARSRSSALESALQAAKSAGRAALETGGSTAGIGRFPSFRAPGAPPAPPSPNGSNYDPAKIGAEVWYEEFKNLALTFSQLAERMSAVEAELKRLGRENQEIREYLSRQRP
jgi:signal recognition particle receptor subunit beta